MENACRVLRVSDITYIWTLEGWLYLAVIIDLHSRMVVGWSMSERLDRSLVLDASDVAVLQVNDLPYGPFSDTGRLWPLETGRIRSDFFIDHMARIGYNGFVMVETCNHDICMGDPRLSVGAAKRQLDRLLMTNA